MFGLKKKTEVDTTRLVGCLGLATLNVSVMDVTTYNHVFLFN